MNLNFKKLYKHPIFPALIIVLITIIIILFKSYQNPKDIKTLKDIGNAISKTNLDIDIDEKNISSTSYIESMKNKVTKLENIKKTVETFSLKDEFKPILNNLNDGISNNITLYSQLITILQENNSSTISKSYDNIISIKNTTEKIYKLCTDEGIPVYLTKDNNKYFDNILSHINDIIKANRDKDIHLKQKNEFILSLDRIRRNLTPLTENLFDTLSIIKKDNRNIDVLISDIHKKIMDFHNFKGELYLISIPKDGEIYFNSLEQICTLFEEYINTFLKALNEEINTNNEQNNLYSDAKEKYLQLEKELKDFDKSIEEFKNK